MNIPKDLPNWFKEKYKVELNVKEEPGQYWVRLEDAIRLVKGNE